MARFISYLASFVLAAGGIRAESIVGSWLTQGAGESKSDAVLTFTANGIYFLAEDGSSVLDPSGKDGMERGTYSWNPTTKAFSSKTQVDTNGQWGLSSGDIRKITVSANTLKFGNVTFKRIQPNAKNLDGPWLLKEGSGYALVTFLPGGSYFMVQDGKADKNVKSGMERGTFTWDPQTGVFTRKIIRDTNGSWGFSDLAKRKIVLGKNTITIEVEGDGTAKLSRVLPP
jgi:hypothetical protein